MAKLLFVLVPIVLAVSWVVFNISGPAQAQWRAFTNPAKD
ncbi:MAG: photosystem II protein Y [Prochlorococcus sp.]|nr:photosystem II protein Y [Prochlorococcus sp.]